jgi:acyl-CoA thioesterase-2
VTDLDTAATPSSGAELLSLLSVREIGADTFVADPVEGAGSNGSAALPGLYGGQVLAQALLAADGTVSEERLAHSLHVYFVARGQPDQPVTFDVARDRDGRSFSARRVVARQGERVILTAAASFTVGEGGPDRQGLRAPTVVGPEDSEPMTTHLVGVEVRTPPVELDRGHPSRVWMRSELGSTPRSNAAGVAYASDLFSGMTTFLTVPPNTFFTTLDHAIWFHRPFRMQDWVLMDLVGVSLASGRGWYTGQFYDHTGQALASLAQEVLLRMPDEPV